MEFHGFSPLEQPFIGRGVATGGILLFPEVAAVDLIVAACDHDVPVLGVNSFVLGEEGTQPVLEHSLDLSRSALDLDSWWEAMAFIWRRPRRDLHFEIVLDTPAA